MNKIGNKSCLITGIRLKSNMALFLAPFNNNFLTCETKPRGVIIQMKAKEEYIPIPLHFS